MIKSKSRIAAKALSIFYVVALLAIIYIPIMLIVIFSFNESLSFGIGLENWKSFTFSLGVFKELFSDSVIIEALINSLIIGLVAAFLATIIGTFSAIGLYHCRKRLRSAVEYAGQITMFNADIVTALAMLVFFIYINVNNEWAKLLIGHTVICLPYAVMSIIPRLAQLDPNVYEAGLDLGASPMRTLFTVVLPQLAGGMVAGFALAFTISMDDFTLSNFLSNNVNTIPKYLYSSIKHEGMEIKLRALSTVLLVAIMLVLVAVNIAAVKRKKKLKKI